MMKAEVKSVGAGGGEDKKCFTVCFLARTENSSHTHTHTDKDRSDLPESRHIFFVK